MKKYDTVIIGGGLGGLLCGYILSKEGRSVCILEKNERVGGCLQTFDFDGRSFDSCVYYFGGYDKGQNLRRYFRYFGLADKLDAVRMDEGGFDRIAFMNGRDEFKIAMGYENFIETLAEKFPSERQALKEYIKAVRSVCADFPLYNPEMKRADTLDKKDLHANAREFIASLTADRRLRGVLAGENLLYAGVGAQTPLYVHALITNSFIQGAWRFRGGSGQLADLLAGSIKAMGGEILTGSEVTGIIAEGGKAKSVRLADSRIIEAGDFISDIHPSLALGMIEGGDLRKVYRERMTGLPNTVSAFLLYITLKEDRIKPASCNYFYYKDENVWDTHEYLEDEWPKSCLVSFSEPEAGKNCAGTLSVASYMRYDEVRKWENTVSGERGDGYAEFKRKKAEILISFLRKKRPDLADNIRSYCVSTPLSLRNYTGTVGGAMYGISRDCARARRTLVMTRTKLPNLYLTGQNTVLHGLLGVTISSVLTCGELVGTEKLLDKIRNA